MIKNIYLKIMSVIIALSLWIMVVSSQTETVSMSVPVKLINPPEGYIAVSSVDSVSVTVRGASRLVNNLKYGSVLLNVDVSKFSIGDSIRNLLQSEVKTPLGIEVVEVVPSKTVITIGQLYKKKVKVIPTFIGEVLKGYKVESVIAKPEVVEINGAKSKLKNITSITTLPINLSDTNENNVFNIRFKLEDGVKTVNPNTTKVTVTIKPDIVTKELKSISVSCLDLPKGLKLKKNVILTSVKVSGRLDLVDNFTMSSKFIVNCSDIKDIGKYRSKVMYQTELEGIEVLNINPPKINFEIVK